VIATKSPTAALKLLADPTRLRMLALLEREELSVGELSKALGAPQSRVSNHLRLLREAGWLSERHSGSSTFLRLAHSGIAGAGDEDLEGRLWNSVRTHLHGLPEYPADLARLDAVLQGRRSETEFFDSLAGQYDKIGGSFKSGQARQRAAASMLRPDLVIADLGCGTGYMAGALIGLAAKLILVDRSEAMLEQARTRFERSDLQLELRQGVVEQLPLADAEVDGVLAGMVLHHLGELSPALGEFRRVLKPGGTAVVLEMLPHSEEWMRSDLGDRHLGLEPGDVLAAFKRAGFTDVRLDSTDDAYCPTSPTGEAVQLPLFLVRGRAPA
jgi:SAM-dependent methyltransferase